jgi:type I restriction enzyme M protein
MARKSTRSANGSANLGFEATLWAAADKLRSNMDAAEYKHVVLGLIFLKYISDSFTDRRRRLQTDSANPKSEWYVAEPQARYAVLVNRILRKYGHPPDKQEKAAETVLAQAELLSAAWAW